MDSTDERASAAIQLATELRLAGEYLPAAELANAVLDRTTSAEARFACEIVLADCELDSGEFVAGEIRITRLLAELRDSTEHGAKKLVSKAEIKLAYAEFNLT